MAVWFDFLWKWNELKTEIAGKQRQQHTNGELDNEEPNRKLINVVSKIECCWKVFSFCYTQNWRKIFFFAVSFTFGSSLNFFCVVSDCRVLFFSLPLSFTHWFAFSRCMGFRFVFFFVQAQSQYLRSNKRKHRFSLMLHLFRDSGMTLFLVCTRRNGATAVAFVNLLCTHFHCSVYVAATSPLSIQFTSKYI